MSLNGSCLCGAITIKVTTQTPPTSYLCHCKNCRKACGSLFSHNLIVKDSEVETTGELGRYVDTRTDSGTPLERFFCRDCGSPVKSITPMLKGVTFVKLGNFENNVPAPVFEAYVKDRLDFEKAWEGIGQFEVNPPAAG